MFRDVLEKTSAQKARLLTRTFYEICVRFRKLKSTFVEYEL